MHSKYVEGLLQEGAKSKCLSVSDYVELLQNTMDLYEKEIKQPFELLIRIAKTTCNCPEITWVENGAFKNPLNHRESCNYRRLHGL